MTTPKKIIKILLIVGVALSIFGCATTKRDWKEANRQGTIMAYEQFLQSHPDAKQASFAKRRLGKLRAEEDWKKAETMNTIGGYKDFLDKHPQSKQARQASAHLEQLESERDWEQAKSSGTIASYDGFIQKHPRSKRVSEAKQELERLEAERDWKSAHEMNTRRSFEEFLKTHPSSQHASEARKRLQEIAYNEAVLIGTDEALIAFIKEFDTTTLAGEAIKKLKGYESIPTRQVIPWSALPNVYAGEASSGGDTYSCGIDMRAFSAPPRVDYQGQSLMVGARRFFKPYSAILHFSRWSSFDGYLAKGKANVSSKGLEFYGKSIVLRKR